MLCLNFKITNEASLQRSKEREFLYYDLDYPSYIIYLRNERNVASSENVIFDEKVGMENGYNDVGPSL